MTFVVPFMTALLLGAVGITRQAWRDEHATWWAATIPLPDLGSLLSHVDIVLAPYYLFMRAWIFVAGDSVVALRLPSLLAMATAAGLTSVLGARLFAPWVGVTAGCLLAVLPSVSRYAEEARPYAFAICFAVASVLAVLARRWALVAVFVALTGLAHLIALTVLLAHLPLVLTRPSSPAVSRPAGGWRDLDHGVMWRWAIAVAVGVAPVVPIVILGARQTQQVDWIQAGWRNLVTLPMSLTRSATAAGILAALALLGLLAAGKSAAPSAAALPDHTSADGLSRSGHPPGALSPGALSPGGLPLGDEAGAETGGEAGRAAARGQRGLVVLVVWAVGPPLLIFVLAPEFFYYRYLLFTLPAWVLLAAIGAAQALRQVSARRQAFATAALCAAVLALGARDQVSVRKSPLPGDQDYQGAAGYVSANLATGDEVYFDGYADHRERFGFAYELRKRAAPALCADLVTCSGRVWLVTNRVVPAPAGFGVLDAQQFSGLEVQLLLRDR